MYISYIYIHMCVCVCKGDSFQDEVGSFQDKVGGISGEF